MTKLIAFLCVALMALSFTACDAEEKINGISDSIVQAGAEALGDYLREDESWKQTQEG